MAHLLARVRHASIVVRMLAGFLVGASGGTVLWLMSLRAGHPVAERILPWIAPFGTVFVHMLKMVVIPVVFLSLILGASSLPLRQFGRVGARIIGWYLLTSVLAACVGVTLAVLVRPGAGTTTADWERIASTLGTGEDETIRQRPEGTTLGGILLGVFRNPFESLATGDFLPMIVFALLFGLAARVLLDARGISPDQADSSTADGVARLLEVVGGAQRVVFRIVEWVLAYAPIGVCALSLVNFGLYGPAIVGPYVRIVFGVVAGVALMMLGVYPLLMVLFARRHPFQFYARVREPLLTAFTTRSSAATLPVTLRAASRLGVPPEVSGFALPLGATVNMDGVCIHLPFFAVLASTLFGIHLFPVSLLTMVLLTVLASIGAGGVPGGSLMLLFLILGSLGLDGRQIGLVVALALGVNPILDMFETMNNVADDLTCVYVVASREGLLGSPLAPGGSLEAGGTSP